jgi:4-amino-4-deoxy-L-arabinose transferase-like glycosyltransferase
MNPSDGARCGVARLGKHKRLYMLLVIVGVAIRLGFILAANSQQPTFLSGGSDAPVYVLLSQNVLAGRGFSYAGEASAFRPPGYPLLLAGSQFLFGSRYITAIRVVQFAIGLLTVLVCSKISLRIYGAAAQRATMIMGLFLPTLIFSTAQLLTECVAAFLTTIFLWLLVKQQEEGDMRSAAGLGLVAGLESLIRFNAAALPIFAAIGVVLGRRKVAMFPRVLAIVLFASLVVSPWFIRNERVFHGQVLFSTHTGANLVQGVVTTQGRTQVGDTEKLKKAMGWSLPDLETNDSRRQRLPWEVELNSRAITAAPRLWVKEGWHAVPLLGHKIADFWLSSDQFLDTRSLPLVGRAVRVLGVLAYLVVLGFAFVGIVRLNEVRAGVASLFIVYAVGLTLLHLPFVMNTRLRIPLMEPLVVILGGIGWSGWSPLSRKPTEGLRAGGAAASVGGEAK